MQQMDVPYGIWSTNDDMSKETNNSQHAYQHRQSHTVYVYYRARRRLFIFCSGCCGFLSKKWLEISSAQLSIYFSPRSEQRIPQPFVWNGRIAAFFEYIQLYAECQVWITCKSCNTFAVMQSCVCRGYIAAIAHYNSDGELHDKLAVMSSKLWNVTRYMYIYEITKFLLYSISINSAKIPTAEADISNISYPDAAWLALISIDIYIHA